MCAHVTHRTCTVIPQTTPSEVQDVGMVSLLRSRAQPYIIVQVLWHLYTGGAIEIALTPHGTVGPQVHLTYVTNHTTLDPLHGLHGSLDVMSLITHLCYDTGLLRQVA